MVSRRRLASMVVVSLQAAGRWLVAVPARAVGLVVFLAALAWMPRLMERIDPITGDEPHYVMTAISVIDDRDLDERNNWYVDRDFERLGFGYLEPHVSKTARDGLYTPHGLGLSYVIALPYAIGGRVLVLVVLAGIAALVAGNTALLARRYAAWPLASVVGLGLALTVPLGPFSLLIYSEMPAALCLVYAARRLLAERNGLGQWVALGGCVAFLPWLHMRHIVFCLAIAAVVAVRHRRAFDRRTAFCALILPVASAVVLAGWYVFLYGRPLPQAADHAGFAGFPGTVNGFFGLLFDQQWGLLTHNPILALAIACAVPFGVARWRDAATLAALALPYVVMLASYRLWWGEWAPPARHLVVVTPLLAAPLAWWVGRATARVRWPTLAIVAVPAAAVMGTFVVQPDWMYNHPDGASRLLAGWGGLGGWLSDALPSFAYYHDAPVELHRASPLGERRLAGAIGAGLLALLAVFAWRTGGPRLAGARRPATISGRERWIASVEAIRARAARAAPTRGGPPVVGVVDPGTRRRGARFVGGRQERPGTVGAFRERVSERVWGARVGLAATAVYLAATVAMTWPYATRLGSATVAGEDPLLQIWLARWIQHALATDPRHLYEANIFYPFAQTLAYTDANIPGALMAAPLFLLTGDAILTNSVLTLGTFLLAAGGMYAVAAHVTRNRGVALLAGLAYAFLPFRYVHLWHLNWLEHAWLPWIFLVLLRLIGRPRGRTAVGLGVLIAILSLTSFYFVVQIGIVVGATLAVAAVGDRRWPSRSLTRHLGLAFGLAAVLTVPFYLPYLEVRERQGLERTAAETERFKARPASYLSLAPWDRDWWSPLGRPGTDLNVASGTDAHADGHRHGSIIIEDALFPGTVALVGAALAVVGWRRHRRAAATLSLIGGVAFVLSLGPSLGPTDGSGLPLPYGFLFERVPFFTAMRVPARLGGLVAFAVVALAALGAAWAWAWLRPRLVHRHGAATRGRRWSTRGGPRLAGAALTALVAGLIVTELHAAPIPLETVDRRPEIAAPYEWLAAQPGEGAVAEFPLENPTVGPTASSVRRHAGLAMFWSTTHWKPIVNGISGFIPGRHVSLLEEFTDDLVRADGSISSDVSYVRRDNVGLLQQLGVRYLLFHRSQYRAEDWPAIRAHLDRLEGPLERVGDLGEATIYEVRLDDPPAAGATLLAPAATRPDAPWQPLLVVTRRGDGPNLLSFERRLAMSVTWYDEWGDTILERAVEFDLPAFLHHDRLRCPVDGCRPGSEMLRLTHPSRDGLALPWHPPAAGAYTVRIEVTGEISAGCTVRVDVLDGRKTASSAPWWRCGADGEPGRIDQPVDVEVPGPTAPSREQRPRVTAPAAMVIDGQFAVEATFTSETEQEIRAWFFLAKPGEAEPWNRYWYRSPDVGRIVHAGQSVQVEWLVPVEVPDGTYQVSLWFHRREGGRWVHAAGGDFDLPPLTIEAGGAPSASGPFAVSLDRPMIVARPGEAVTLRPTIGGVATDAVCWSRWRLAAVADDAEVAAGESRTCREVRLAVPSDVAPGFYRVEVAALAVDGEERHLSDEVVRYVVVLSWPD